MWCLKNKQNKKTARRKYSFLARLPSCFAKWLVEGVSARVCVPACMSRPLNKCIHWQSSIINFCFYHIIIYVRNEEQRCHRRPSPKITGIIRIPWADTRRVSVCEMTGLCVCVFFCCFFFLFWSVLTVASSFPLWSPVKAVQLILFTAAFIIAEHFFFFLVIVTKFPKTFFCLFLFLTSRFYRKEYT